jgi:hypothetical protein
MPARFLTREFWLEGEVQFFLRFGEEFAKFAAKIGTGTSDATFPSTYVDMRCTDTVRDLLLRPVLTDASIDQVIARSRWSGWSIFHQKIPLLSTLILKIT